MESDSTSGQRPLDFTYVTDDELLELLPVRQERTGPRNQIQTRHLKPEEQSALDELWKRHSEKVEGFLRAKIHQPGSTLCPPEEPNREHFFCTCFNEFRLIFFRRLCREEHTNFASFLFTMALNAALDVRDHIIGTSKDPVTIIHDDDVTKDIADPGKNPFQTFAVRELRDMFDEYAELSPGNALSITIARLKRGEDLKWDEILEEVNKLFPGKIIGTTQGARTKKLRDVEKHDKKNILPWLLERKITGPF